MWSFLKNGDDNSVCGLIAQKGLSIMFDSWQTFNKCSCHPYFIVGILYVRVYIIDMQYYYRSSLWNESYNEGKDFCLFCSFLYPQQLEQCMTHGTHPRNICWMNETLRIWRGYSRNCSPRAILNQKLAVLFILANNFDQPTGQIARLSWISYRTSYAGMLCPYGKLCGAILFDGGNVYLCCWYEKSSYRTVYTV